MTIESRVHWTDDPQSTTEWRGLSPSNEWTDAVELLLTGPPRFESITLHSGRGADFEYRVVTS